MKKKTFSIFPAAVLLIAASLWASGPSYGDESDHKRAREALLAGDILPLRTVLDRVEQAYPGQAVKIEFEEDDGIYLYKIKLLQNTGDMIKLKVDATHGRIIGVKGRGMPPKGDD